MLIGYMKEKIKKIPIVDRMLFKRRLISEYAYDRKFFLENYSHSEITKNTNSYNIILILHSIEKGLSSEKPRRFGVKKINDLNKLLDSHAKFDDYESDFAFIYAINTLRSYVEFYRLHKWTGAPEYEVALGCVKKYDAIEAMEAGSITIYKKDYEKGSRIDYGAFLKSRHSVRKYSNTAIRIDDLKKAIKMASLTPSACNRQMCRAYYIKDSNKRKRVIRVAQGFGGFEEKTINLMLVTFDVSANYFVGERNQGWLNAGLFSMNLVNALHSLGIGSCFCQFGNSTSEEEAIKKDLGISKSERIAVLIACGYYCDENRIPCSPRKEISEYLTII